MKPLIVALCVLAATLIPQRQAAAAILTIDFDSLAEGVVLRTQIPTLTFTNATVLTAGSSLNEFEFPPFSGQNVVFDDGGPLRIDFATPVRNVQAYFTYVVPLHLEAFSAANASVGSVKSSFQSNLGLSGDVGSAPNDLLILALGGISYVIVTGDSGAGSSFTLDNLSFETSPIPEPSGLVLLSVAVSTALARVSRRRRHPKVSSTAA